MRLLARADFCEEDGDAVTAILLREATNEIDRKRRQIDQLISYLNGISRTTAEMVRANSDN